MHNKPRHTIPDKVPEQMNKLAAKISIYTLIVNFTGFILSQLFPNTSSIVTKTSIISTALGLIGMFYCLIRVARWKGE